MSTPRAAASTRVDQQVEECRDDHASERRRNGHRGKAAVGQVPDQDLALYLERDQKEEPGHQQVVDPVAQVLLDLDVASADPQARVPDALVPGRVDVGPDQGRDRRNEQEKSAARLKADELGDPVHAG